MKYTLDPLVTSDHYESLKASYPGMLKRIGHARMLGHLFITGRLDKATLPDSNDVGIFTPYQIIESCYAEQNWERMNTAELLDRFLSEVYPFPVREFSRGSGRARTIYIPRRDDDVRLSQSGPRDVCLTTGSSVHSSTVRRAILSEKLEAEQALPEQSPLCKAQRMLHTVDIRNFNITEEEFEETLRLVDTNYSGAIRDHWVKAVQRVYINSPHLPVYSQPENSPRIYTKHPLLYLPSDLRRSLTRGCSEMDLQAAHLAISARVLGVHALCSFLEDGGNPWEEFTTWTKLSKESVKGAVNPFLYGAGLATMSSESGLTPEEVKLLFKHPFLRELKKARSETLKAITSDGYVDLPFTGTRVLITPKQSALSAMAQVNQDYEAKIISRVFDYAETVPHLFRIVYFQHDGFTFRIRVTAQRRAVVAGLKAWVDLTCKDLCIPTRLVEVDA